jgi:pilus assembly protein Flp/PilA
MPVRPNQQETSLMRALVTRFVKDVSGATSIEYSLIAVGIAAVIISAVTGLGSAVLDRFNVVNNGFR